MSRVLSNIRPVAAPGPLYLPPAPTIERVWDALSPVRKFLRREPSLLFTAVAAVSTVVIAGTIMFIAWGVS